MKKFFKILLIVLLVLIVGIVAGVGYVVYAINDSTDRTPSKIRTNNYPSERVINRVVTDSLVSTDDDINIALDGYTINEILYSTLKRLSLSPIEILGCYTEFDSNDNLVVQIPLNVQGFKTSLSAKVKITESTNSFTLKLNQGDVGKLSISNSIVKKIVEQTVDAREVEKELKAQGIDAKISTENYTFTITKKALIEKINDALKDDKNSALYKLLLNLCMEKPELFQLHLCENKRIGFTIKASNMLYDDSRDGTFTNTIDYDYAVSQVKNDLGSSRVNYKNVAAAFDYQIIGYENLSSEEKAYIDALGYDTTYKGQVHYTANSMKTFILEQEPSAIQIAQALINHELSMKITEAQFNELFSAMNFVGKSVGFTNDTDVGYFSFETLYIDIKENAFDLTIILNVSGRRLAIQASLDAPKNNDFKIDATLTGLRIGNVAIEEKYYSDLLAYLNSAMESTEWISADPTNKKITIDLESIVKGGESFGDLESHIVEKSLEFTDDGKLKLSYVL